MLQEDTPMVAIIVGMITGSLCMIFALFYLLQLNNPPQVWGIVAACVGGGIFLLSAVLMAISTIAGQKRNRASAKVPPEPAAPTGCEPSPEPEPVEAPEPDDLSPGSGMPELDAEDLESSMKLAESEEEQEEGTA
jgi:hypothetical protein